MLYCDELHGARAAPSLLHQANDCGDLIVFAEQRPEIGSHEMRVRHTEAEG